MKSKSMLAVLAAMMIMALVAGCVAPAAPAAAPAASEAEAPAESEAAAPAAESEIYIPVISKGFQHQFWQAVELGANQAAEEYGVSITFEGPENESQVDKQLEMFQTALDKSPSAICLAALDTQALNPLLERAQAEGIPVVGFDSGVDSDIPVTTATTDNVAAAAYAADKMAELIGGSGKVAVIAHDQTSRTGIDRVAGFVDRMAEAYPDIAVVDVQYGGGDQLKSTDLAKAIMQANPDLAGFFGANEGSIIGVLNAATELDMGGKITIIGYDAGTQQKEAVRSGLQAGAISQDPVGIGFKCVEAAVMAINGEELPPVIDTGFKWYDASNIDDPELQPLLYD
jgi:ribose transport system substrate-binding protein